MVTGRVITGSVLPLMITLPPEGLRDIVVPLTVMTEPGARV
jgi:hypothetical protein